MGSPSNPAIDKFGRVIVPPEYDPSGPANSVTFGLSKISPPSPLYIQRDDTLVLTATTNNGALDTVTCNIRMLLAPFDGGRSGTVIVPEQAVIPLTAAYTPVSQTVQLSEGYLLSVGVIALSAAQRGTTFVRAQIQRGKTATVNGPVFRTMFADYVTRNQSVGWPDGRVLNTLEGPGSVFNQTNAQPGAGADWAFGFNALSRTRVISFNAQLLTSAVVANRIVRVQVKDGSGNIVYQGSPSAVIPASTTAQVTGLVGLNSAVTDPQTVNIALPPIILTGAGTTIGVSTTNLQAGDQWGQQNIYVEQWLDNV